MDGVPTPQFMEVNIMNTITKTVLAAAAALTFAGCANNTAANTSETDPIIGQWQLSTVEKVVEGEEQQFLNREENASFFENEDNYYEFKSDGTVSYFIYEGGEAVEDKGTWKKTELSYNYTNGSGMSVDIAYNAEDDTLTRVLLPTSDAEDFDIIIFSYARKK